MLITRTPYRVSLFGGGTDYPDWYLSNNGSVISFAINRYSYITCRYLPEFFEYKYRIRYFVREEVNFLEEIKHPSVRESIKLAKIKNGLDIVHHGDLPAMSGLGTSSSFTVGMIHILEALKGKTITKLNLARKAIKIEQEINKESVGSQDQVAASYGGFNRINFAKNGEITVTKIIISEHIRKKLLNSICIFFTGLNREASQIAKTQIENIKSGLDMSQTMKLVDEFEDLITNSKNFVEEFGLLLEKQWLIKKRYSLNVSNNSIDAIYEKAKFHGAIGGKLLGAGNGGFILFVTKDKERLVKGLSEILHVPIDIDYEGSKLIYNG